MAPGDLRLRVRRPCRPGGHGGEASARGRGPRVRHAGRAASQSSLVRELGRFLRLYTQSLLSLGVTAVACSVVEGIEAVGLWLERRWAEYLTAVATAGFLPFEIHELIDRVTWVRIVA